MSALAEAYRLRFNRALAPLAPVLEQHLRDNLDQVAHIDRIAARPKSVERFLAKASTRVNGRPKYSEPLQEIQDQIGARIIVFYKSDVEPVRKLIHAYYRPIEAKSVVPESQWEFGYFGEHYVLLLPTDLKRGGPDDEHVPDCFELQIKTLFQHAWSEANHDLGYKSVGAPLTPDETRRLAFTAAQAWGADQIFDELARSRGAAHPASP